MNAGPRAHLLANPGEVLLRGARVDDQQIVVFAQAVHEDVVDEGALRREQRGVVRLPIHEARRVVHGDVLDSSKRAGTAKLDLAHVAHVEETDGGAHRHVLPNQSNAEAAGGSGVFDGHIPSAEVDHLCLERAMRGVQRGLFERGGGGRSRIGHAGSFR